jgi:hypothetical protein
MSIEEIKARHDTKNRNAYGKIIFTDELHLADEDRGELLTRIAELEARLDKIRPYVQHKRDCAIVQQHYAFHPECNCGLETIKEEVTE